MMISGLSQSASTRDVNSNSDYRTSTEDASSTSFAAMLAGRAAEARRAEEPKAKTDEGTSDLDHDSDDSSDDGDSSTSSSTSSTAAAQPSLADRLASLGSMAAGLSPVFGNKLARVVDRMRDEYGKTVTVNEGLRSQARQDALYAQGRTASGPVVTWTKNSLHSKGLAADLMVDGGYSDAQGFADLQKVAREEGLHTLGKIDPGHVELKAPADSAQFVEGIGVPASAGTVAAPRIDARIAQVARVASVANVAQVAQPRVASVASVAQASVASTGASNVRNGDAQSRGRDSSSQSGSSHDGARGESRATDAASESANGNARAYAELSKADATSSGADAVAATTPTSSAAARVEQAMDLQDSRGAKVLTRLNLSVDDGNGGQDTVRIGMRGAQVGATIDMKDQASATRVSARLGELTSALERRGLEPQTFTVRHTGQASVGDSATAKATVISTSSSSSARNDDQAGARNSGRQAQDSDDQAARRQQADDRRRRNTNFSLTTEEA